MQTVVLVRLIEIHFRMPVELKIRKKVECPNCWQNLNPADLLWVSTHPDLRGDEFLGQDAQHRFLPSRFDTDGFAIDPKGNRCQILACPKCHLTVPRVLVDLQPMFISVIGAPRSGKSYFLASTIWMARQRLRELEIHFLDCDPVANQIVTGYEKRLFLTDQPESFVALPKTETEGDLYQPVHYPTHSELYARPFVFSLSPTERHVLFQRGAKSVRHFSRALCLYDNAGEHFQPSAQSEQSPATDHLALSEALIFVFDPLQHPKFRRACREHSQDPQLNDPTFHRQDEVLQEAAKRIRQKLNLAQHERFERPLIVVVNKFDVWRSMIPDLELEKLSPYANTPNGVVGVNDSLVREISDLVKGLLNRTSPEIVSVCESFCSDVTFVPISPQGCAAELNPDSGQNSAYGVRPININPIWAEVPLLYAVSRTRCDLIPSVRRKTA